MALAGGGYEYDFEQDPPDRLVCAICHLPCRDPQLSTCCGTNFCKADIERFMKAISTVTKVCPVCRKKFEWCINHQASREINALRAYCPNKSAGCEWIGKVKEVTTHRENDNGCLFEMLECPHGCGLEHQRQNLPSHIEAHCPCYCEHCDTTADKKVISSQHKEKCAKYPIPCPNKCGKANIPYEKLDKHRADCPLEVVECPYSFVGCPTKICRKNREKHNAENMEKHLALVNTHITKMEGAFAGFKLASAQKYEKLEQTLDEAIKNLHTKVTLDEVKTEQDKSSNRLTLTIQQKTNQVKQDANAKLLQEVGRLANKKSVENVQREVANLKGSGQQTENKVTALQNCLNREVDAVKKTIQDEIKQRKALCTWQNFILLIYIIAIPIIIAIARR